MKEKKQGRKGSILWGQNYKQRKFVKTKRGKERGLKNQVRMLQIVTNKRETKGQGGNL